MNDTIRDFLKIMENQFIGVTIMTRSGICREYKILEVEENYVRTYLSRKYKRSIRKHY